MSTSHAISGDDDRLPDWFQRPCPRGVGQYSLFPEPLGEALAAMRVSTDELARWHEHGWVSFGPMDLDELQPWHVNEVVFVRDVVRSGLSDAHIAHLFDQLPRPMAFEHAATAYSFTLGWVAPRRDPVPEPSEVVEGWLQELADGGHREALVDLHDRIGELLGALPPTEEEDE